MRNILTIFKKQIKDTLKNKTVLIQFILFPVLTMIFENAINIEGMEENFFTKLFSTSYIFSIPSVILLSGIFSVKSSYLLSI